MIRAAAFFRIRTRKSHENRKRNYAQKYVTKTVKTIQKKRGQNKKQLMITEYYGIIYKNIAKRIA